jgi:ABC-type glutathione transport system ATPase component
MNSTEGKPTIGIVGPCGSGKTTLALGLKQRQITVRHIAQEHSYVPDMWNRISHPTILVYLSASYQTATLRRKLNWTIEEYEEQLHRLRNARAHANLIIETDTKTPESILDEVLNYIVSHS